MNLPSRAALKTRALQTLTQVPRRPGPVHTLLRIQSRRAKLRVKVRTPKPSAE